MVVVIEGRQLLLLPSNILISTPRPASRVARTPPRCDVVVSDFHGRNDVSSPQDVLHVVRQLGANRIELSHKLFIYLETDPPPNKPKHG